MPRKIGICIGQNNYAPSSGVSPLKGCINDALLIGELLRIAGFEVTQLHDEAATQSAILGAIESTVSGLRAGDSFVLWNASHGYQVRETAGGDELDYTDEAICCYDNDRRNPLSDDKLARLLRGAHQDASLFIGSDSCHSGTVTRALLRQLAGLPGAASDETRALARELMARDSRFTANGIERRDFNDSPLPAGWDHLCARNAGAPSTAPTTRGTPAPGINDPLTDEADARLFIPREGAGLFEVGQNFIRVLDYVPNAGTSAHAYVSAERPLRRLGVLATPDADAGMTHLLLSGCRADEVSWDAPFPQGRHGVMTYYFAVAVLDAWLKRKEPITYERAHAEATTRIGARFAQHPQLEGPPSLKTRPVFGFVPV